MKIKSDMKNLFYIGERINPQLQKSYYIDYGQLTEKESLESSKCLYGSIVLTSYNTKEEYQIAKTALINNGFKVINY